MNSKILPILALALLALLSSCSPQNAKLTFLVTTDVHGAFFPLDPISEKQQKGSMAHVSSYINQFPDRDDLVLLDNGDILQGDPSAYYYNFEQTDSTHLFTRILHYLHYDAATIGNHDIEAGHAVYDRINNELELPWLAANCIDTKSGEPYFEPYAIIRKGKIKIAVLGLITPRIPDWLPENIWSGMEFVDMVESAKKWIPIIQNTEKPDVIVGLFHAGVDYTYNNQNADTEKNENAVRLVAESVAGFDIIFAGHDHKTWNEYQVDPSGDSVLILGSQSRAREIAQADLSLKKVNGKWEIISLTGQNIYLGNMEPDLTYSEHFYTDYTLVKKYVNQDVAELKTKLESSKAIFGPSEFMTLIHQVQLGISKADISFAAPLAFNSTIEPGMLKVNDLFDLYRFENLLYTMELSGQEILDYLNYSYGKWFNQMANKTDHLIQMNPDGNGSMRTATAYYNFESAMGLDYQIDLRKKTGSQVDILSLSTGQKFDLQTTYKVAINSYRGNGGGGHLTEGAGIPKEELPKRMIESTDKDLRFYMKAWMIQEEVIEVSLSTNWKVLPVELYEAGKERDYNIFFKN